MDIMNSFIGKTLTNIVADDDFIRFTFSDGDQAEMLHYQDCCEHVYVEDVCGDWDDLLHSPLVLSEEVTNYDPAIDDPEQKVVDILKGTIYTAESETWTYYRMGTTKGCVSIRWYGSSNGYYSESVSVRYISKSK